MRRVTKMWAILLCGIVIVIAVGVLWWAHYMFWVPHFHEDQRGDLVSGKTRLILVSKLLPGDKSGITVPSQIPFWNSIGIVDGAMDGRLWKFTDHEKQYVLYVPNTEMSWHWVYKDSANK